MISTCKECVLEDKHHHHARIQLTRCGTVAIDIPETNEHIDTELDSVEIRSHSGKLCLVCQAKLKSRENIQRKALPLQQQDALELNQLIREASEEYETLMNDLL
ncbi:hypothetical protein ACFODT_07900 [Vibrio zhugei]|uniref:Uncharacterized protein n=1 Tax=Vibrio zhugei TaxID=2479546 RepID=A0ABV7CBA2_9VIBR|nr:hypothetical protein [Vibrio zhugei]